MWDKLERKYGNFAIPHLMNYVIGGYILGYFLILGQKITGVSYLSYMTLDPYQIIHGSPFPQIWRVITWVLIPPFGTSNMISLFFGIIMMVLYWQLGNVLERTWGTFRFNIFILGGILFTVIGSFIVYAFMSASGSDQSILASASFYNSLGYSTNYINMSIFLAFALCYPDMTVLLYFVIPIKMKWMSIVYAGFALYDFIVTGFISVRVSIIASALSFLLFYLSTRESYHVSYRGAQRRAAFKNAQQKFQEGFGRDNSTSQTSGPRHKCCICGRTELTNPELDFRYCSRCNGNYEYCSDHLFTHTHVK